MPRALKSTLVMGSLFVVITWWQGAAYLTHSTVLTATFFLLIVGAAAVVGLLFGPRTWCRYLCPIGLLLGVYSRLSPLELRPTPEKCRDCRTVECIRGDGRTPGCPMTISPRHLETNRHCIYCMNCMLVTGLILFETFAMTATYAVGSALPLTGRGASGGELVAALGWAGR